MSDLNLCVEMGDCRGRLEHHRMGSRTEERSGLPRCQTLVQIILSSKIHAEKEIRFGMVHLVEFHDVLVLTCVARQLLHDMDHPVHSRQILNTRHAGFAANLHHLLILRLARGRRSRPQLVHTAESAFSQQSSESKPVDLF